MNMSSRPKVGAHVRNTKTDADGYVIGFSDFGQTVVIDGELDSEGGPAGWSLFDIEVIK